MATDDGHVSSIQYWIEINSICRICESLPADRIHGARCEPHNQHRLLHLSGQHRLEDFVYFQDDSKRIHNFVLSRRFRAKKITRQMF